eukprot:4979678-Pyramimonas_sp.AAC.1
MTSKACGVTLSVRRSRLPPSFLKRALPVPISIWGRQRCGILFGVVSVYDPPRETSRAGRALYDVTLEMISNW